jgi:hypothetical protein
MGPSDIRDGRVRAMAIQGDPVRMHDRMSGCLCDTAVTRRHDGSMAATSALDASYEAVGPRQYLDRFLAEYGLSEEHVRDRIKVRVDGPWVPGGEAGETYLVHTSLLSSHGEFPCAGDRKALAFCRGIAEEMARAFGIPRAEAVARINRQWPEPDAPGRVPRVWIVGLDLVYHETEAFWAADIYYGHGSFWWLPDAHPRSLPSP